MTFRTKRPAGLVFFIIGLAAAAVLHSCATGGDAGPGSSPSPTPAPTAEPSPGPTPAPSPAPSPADATLAAVDAALASGDAGKLLGAVEALDTKPGGQAALEARLLRGNLLLANGRVPEAKEVFESLLAAAPDAPASFRADLRFGLYLVNRISGNAAAAKRELDAALALDPGHVDALCALGAIETEIKRYPSALARFDLALEREPENPAVLRGKAAVLARTDRVPEAVNLLCDILVRDPEDAGAREDRARLYAELSLWDAALADWNRLVKDYPGDYLLHLDRGRVLARAGKPEEAVKDFTRVLELRPDVTLARSYRGQAWWQIATGEAAPPEPASAPAPDGPVPEFGPQLPPGAAPAASPAPSAAPALPRREFDRAAAEAARADFEAVLAERPGYQPARDGLILANWRLGRLPEAARLFEGRYEDRLKDEWDLVMAVAVLAWSGDKAGARALGLKVQPKIKQDGPWWLALAFLLDPAAEGKAMGPLNDPKDTMLKDPGLRARYQLAVAFPALRLGRMQTGVTLLQNVVDFLPATMVEGRIAAWMLDEYKR